MKILYIHQYFATPQEPGGTRSYWFSQKLLQRGHHVVMVTSTNKMHPDAKRMNIEIPENTELGPPIRSR